MLKKNIILFSDIQMNTIQLKLAKVAQSSLVLITSNGFQPLAVNAVVLRSEVPHAL